MTGYQGGPSSRGAGCARLRGLAWHVAHAAGDRPHCGWVYGRGGRERYGKMRQVMRPVSGKAMVDRGPGWGARSIGRISQALTLGTGVGSETGFPSWAPSVFGARGTDWRPHTLCGCNQYRPGFARWVVASRSRWPTVRSNGGVCCPFSAAKVSRIGCTVSSSRVELATNVVAYAAFPPRGAACLSERRLVGKGAEPGLWHRVRAIIWRPLKHGYRVPSRWWDRVSMPRDDAAAAQQIMGQASGLTAEYTSGRVARGRQPCFARGSARVGLLLPSAKAAKSNLRPLISDGERRQLGYDLGVKKFFAEGAVESTPKMPRSLHRLEAQ